MQLTTAQMPSPLCMSNTALTCERAAGAQGSSEGAGQGVIRPPLACMHACMHARAAAAQQPAGSQRPSRQAAGAGALRALARAHLLRVLGVLAHAVHLHRLLQLLAASLVQPHRHQLGVGQALRRDGQQLAAHGARGAEHDHHCAGRGAGAGAGVSWGRGARAAVHACGGAVPAAGGQERPAARAAHPSCRRAAWRTTWPRFRDERVESRWLRLIDERWIAWGSGNNAGARCCRARTVRRYMYQARGERGAAGGASRGRRHVQMHAARR
jgi:hypothetical protein